MSQKYSKNIMKIQLFGTTNEGDNNPHLQNVVLCIPWTPLKNNKCHPQFFNLQLCKEVYAKV